MTFLLIVLPLILVFPQTALLAIGLLPGEIDRHGSYNNSTMSPLLSVLVVISSITAFIGALRKFKPFPHEHVKWTNISLYFRSSLAYPVFRQIPKETTIQGTMMHFKRSIFNYWAVCHILNNLPLLYLFPLAVLRNCELQYQTRVTNRK